jgi:nucleotide-binding universal stress UspA family protein
VYERILVPLDGTDVAEAAIPYAELIPSRHVRLLQVEPITVTVRQDPEGMEHLKLAQDERRSRASAYLAQQAEGLRRQGRDIELVAAAGDPREKIIAAASDADLIVIGTRGRSVGGRTLGVSIADHVLRNADVPTLLVRGALSQAAPMVARIVVPLDGSDIAESVMPAAARLSRLLGVQPHLVHVVPISRDAMDMDVDAMRQGAAAYLDAQVMRLAAVDLFATRAVLTGPIGSTLLGAILPTDLVVITAHGVGGEQHAPLDRVATRLVAEADGPVLLLHLSHLRVAVDRAAERTRLRDRNRSASRSGQRPVSMDAPDAPLDRPGVAERPEA